jgi:hypothetical protein
MTKPSDESLANKGLAILKYPGSVIFDHVAGWSSSAKLLKV